MNIYLSRSCSAKDAPNSEQKIVRFAMMVVLAMITFFIVLGCVGAYNTWQDVHKILLILEEKQCE